MDVRFDCVQCGKCCHNLKLPLSLGEAIRWLQRGGDIQLLVEAMPWIEEPPADDLAAQHKRPRSFAAMSGDVPVRIGIIVAAAFIGACPHLLPSMRCGFYPQRPAVCGIYPAEKNPFVALDPALKACPPEAWAATMPVLLQEGRVVDPGTAALIEKSRAADVDDIEAKARLAALLGIDGAAFANEGLAVYTPDHDIALAAIIAAIDGYEQCDPVPDWSFVSNRLATVGMLADVGAHAMLAPDAPGFAYVGFFESDTAGS